MRYKMNSIRQDYIQAIYRLSKDKGYTSNKNISDYFSISRPSVSEMIKKLVDDGLVIQEKNKIFLSNLGDREAKNVEAYYIDILSYRMRDNLFEIVLKDYEKMILVP